MPATIFQLGLGIRVSLGVGREVLVDEVVALAGYCPDLSILSELTPAVAPADIDSGEPGFYLAGARSYGRARTFCSKAAMPNSTPS